jgi:hypothetical protein
VTRLGANRHAGPQNLVPDTACPRCQTPGPMEVYLTITRWPACGHTREIPAIRHSSPRHNDHTQKRTGHMAAPAPALVGVVDEDTGRYQARPCRHNTLPATVVLALANSLARYHGGHVPLFSATLLLHDWEMLDPDAATQAHLEGELGGPLGDWRPHAGIGFIATSGTPGKLITGTTTERPVHPYRYLYLFGPEDVQIYVANRVTWRELTAVSVSRMIANALLAATNGSGGAS